MPGGSGVDDDELVSRFADGTREGLEHSDFFGAGRLEILFEHHPAAVVERCTLGGEHMFAVGAGGLGGVDTRHVQVVQGAVQRVGEVTGGVGGGQMHQMSAVGQGDRDSGGDGGLADPALAHTHDQTVAATG